MHKLLERQVRRHFGSLDDVPDGMRPFLDLIDAAYDQADEDRRLLERSMDLASQELVERNEALASQVKREQEVQAALLRSEEDYRRIVETATEGIWLLGPDHRTRFVNQRMADMLGTTRDDLETKTPLDFIVGDRADDARHAFDQLTERMSGTRDVQMRRRDGSKIWVVVSSQAIHGDDGSYQGALGMVSDITARKDAEDGLREAYDQLQDLEQARTDFINSAAHELSTPLTPLKVQVHLLRRQVEPGTPQARSIEVIDRNVERLAGLVSDMLDSSRLQTGTLRMDEEPHDLAVLARQATEAFNELARARGVTLSVEADGALPVRCDAGRISQVLDNLLSNALKFTQERGNIRVRARLQDERPTVRVEDDGEGISRQGLRRLFRPFSQVHELGPDRPQGTGLGLYICKGIVDQSGGHIWAESRGEGEGATFAFALPLDEGGDEEE